MTPAPSTKGGIDAIHEPFSLLFLLVHILFNACAMLHYEGPPPTPSEGRVGVNTPVTGFTATHA